MPEWHYGIGAVVSAPVRLNETQVVSPQTRVSDILCKRGSFTAEAFFPQT